MDCFRRPCLRPFQMILYPYYNENYHSSTDPVTPIELLWANIKSKKIHKYFFHTVEEFQSKLNECCSSIMNTNNWAKNFFKKESLQYISYANKKIDLELQQAA